MITHQLKAPSDFDLLGAFFVDMRKFITINQEASLLLGLSIQESILMAWISNLPEWASKVKTLKGVFYLATYEKAAQDLPLLSDKKDTFYRMYRNLEKKGLIEVKKDEKGVLLLITSKSEAYKQLGKLSEATRKIIRGTTPENSDKNPNLKAIDDETFANDFGKLSENNFEELGKLSEKTRIEIRHIDRYNREGDFNFIPNLVSNAHTHTHAHTPARENPYTPKNPNNVEFFKDWETISESEWLCNHFTEIDWYNTPSKTNQKPVNHEEITKMAMDNKLPEGGGTYYFGILAKKSNSKVSQMEVHLKIYNKDELPLIGKEALKLLAGSTYFVKPYQSMVKQILASLIEGK